ncbi:radical SAM protein [Phocaeicola plebeius]|uniref:radical SAM protein n=1 Tax=Phocaeicola plebeius TaxID=310297 RepID=UPI003568DDD0
MKISKYTIFFQKENNEYYIYNTLSNALIEIDGDLYIYLKNIKNTNSEINNKDVDEDILELLKTKKIIIENDIDNFLYYKSTIIRQRANSSHMHLTIAPTMDCCFNCNYCFEQYKTKSYMSEETMDSIIKYLKSLNVNPDFNITWFGGEPLMAIEQMHAFYKKLATQFKRPLSSNVITTGYHINSDVISILKDIGVSQVQITLDGLKETHNTIKANSECDDVFERVINNAELLLKESDIHVIFRINLTKNNSHEYLELYSFLFERFKNFKNKGIAPAFVMDRGGSISKSDHDKCFTSNEMASFVLDLYNKHGIHSPFLSYPSKYFRECAIRNVASISFDPEGFAYKCWELIGNKKYAIGKLDNNGILTSVNEKLLNRFMYGADPLDDSKCSKCIYLPICNGGCPIQRLENVFEKKSNDCCVMYKNHLKDFLKIHLDLKSKGIENKFD